MPHDISTIIEVLRDRVIRGQRAGTLDPGDRLPSARELVAEFNVDSRLILAAYRQLADEGLVEIRQRGGVYVLPSPAGASAPPLPAKWFAETLAEGLARGISSSDLAECIRRLVETVRLRAIVISSTEDQVAGLARELREDFGLMAEGFPAETLAQDGVHTAALKRADLLVATAAHEALAAELGQRFAKPYLVIDIRPDLAAGEWAMLLRRPVWAVVATAEFGAMLKQFFAAVPGIENLTVLVYGKDDLNSIPLGAPTYVTHRVRETLGVTSMPGRILPPARTISARSATEIFDFIVRANFRAQHALRGPVPDATSRRA